MMRRSPWRLPLACICAVRHSHPQQQSEGNFDCQNKLFTPRNTRSIIAIVLTVLSMTWQLWHNKEMQLRYELETHTLDTVGG